MSGISLDASLMPLLRVTMTGSVNDAAFDVYLREYDQVLAQGRRFAALMDLSSSGQLSAHQRHLQARWIRERKEKLEELCVGTSYVITSSLVRCAFTAVLWLQPLPYEHVIVTTAAEAQRWALRRLQARRVEIPRELASAAGVSASSLLRSTMGGPPLPVRPPRP